MAPLEPRGYLGAHEYQIDNHAIETAVFANVAERDAITWTDDYVTRLVWVESDLAYYRLHAITPSVQWIKLGSGGGGGSGSPDAPPAEPNAADDEFDGDTLDPKWSWVNQGDASLELANGKLLMWCPIGGLSQRMIMQSVASPFIATAKVHLLALYGNYCYCAITVRESSTGKLENLVIVSNGDRPRNQVSRWASPTSYFSTPLDMGTPSGGYDGYLQVEDTGTHIVFRLSMDGVSFYEITRHARNTFFTTGPDQVGLSVSSNNSNSLTLLVSEYFRVVQP